MNGFFSFSYEQKRFLLTAILMTAVIMTMRANLKYRGRGINRFNPMAMIHITNIVNIFHSK